MAILVVDKIESNERARSWREVVAESTDRTRWPTREKRGSEVLWEVVCLSSDKLIGVLAIAVPRQHWLPEIARSTQRFADENRVVRETLHSRSDTCFDTVPLLFSPTCSRYIERTVILRHRGTRHD